MLVDSVSVIIVNYNSGALLAEAVRSVYQQPGVNRVIIVDNASDDGSLEALPLDTSNIRIVRSSRNLGFAGGCNLGAQLADTEYLFFLNPDAILAPSSVEMLVAHEKKYPGIVGPIINVSANGARDVGATINHLGMSVSLDGSACPLYVSGCALLILNSLFKNLGGFDSRYFLFVEDLELCWRALLAGYNVSVSPDAEVYHRGGASIGGGYFRSGVRYSTSTLRVAFRERNSIALMISCAPWWWLPFVLPVMIARAAIIGFGALFVGGTDLVGDIARGLLWNLHELPRSLARRKSITRTRSGSREASRRVVRTPVLLRMLGQSGIPQLEL